MQQRKKWGKSWIQLSSHTLQVYKTLVLLKVGSQGEKVCCHLPRADLVTHSPARPRQSMKATEALFSWPWDVCSQPREHHPSAMIFSIFLLAFFFFPIFVSLFFFHFFSFFAVSPERFDLYFGCYPLLPLTFKTLHSEFFPPFLAFSCLLFLGC